MCLKYPDTFTINEYLLERNKEEYNIRLFNSLIVVLLNYSIMQINA